MLKFLELKIPPLIQVSFFSFAIFSTSKFFPIYSGNKLERVFFSFFCGGSGAVIVLLGVMKFHKSSTTIDPRYPGKSASLVCEGIYRYTRNPMYLGMLVILISFCLYLGSYYSLIYCFFFFWFMSRFQIIPEERKLEDIFGREYISYKEKVRRWI